MKHGYIAIKTGPDGWEGIKKMYAYPSGFGPVLWQRLQENGVEPFEDLLEHLCWGDFIDEYYPIDSPNYTMHNHKAPHSEERWFWILDQDDYNLEIRYASDVSETLNQNVNNFDDGSSEAIEVGKNIWVYGKNHTKDPPGVVKYPKMVKVGRLAKIDLNGEEPEWDLIEDIIKDVKLIPFSDYSKAESLTIKLNEEKEYRECLKCGKVATASSVMGPYRYTSNSLFHSECFNELLEKLNSEKLFYLHRVRPTTKELTMDDLRYK